MDRLLDAIENSSIPVYFSSYYTDYGWTNTQETDIFSSKPLQDDAGQNPLSRHSTTKLPQLRSVRNGDTTTSLLSASGKISITREFFKFSNF